MEEESEKRRERLRAMREEAENAGNSSSVVAPELPCFLSNPLTETPLLEEPRPSSVRFDFYTDPMSAFSASKRRNDANPRMPPESFAFPGPRNTEMTPQAQQYQGRPHQYQGRPHQYQGNYAPGQQMYQPRGRGHNPIPHRNPMGGISRPYNAHQGNQNYPIRPGNAAGYNYNPPPQRGFSPTGSPFNVGQGRGYWVNNNNNNNSPSPGPGHGGRGRCHGSSANPGPGWKGGRGRGSGGGSSGAERFYNESMVEDPWKFLEPVTWTEVRAPNLSKFWAPSPVGAKKARVSDASNKTDSQPSLAEYLAASFNEAVDDSPST